MAVSLSACMCACLECDKCCQVVAKLPLNRNSIIITPLVLLLELCYGFAVRMYAYRWYALFWSHALALSHSLSVSYCAHAPPLSAVAHTDTHTQTHTMKSAWFANTWSRYVYLFNFKRANRAFATSRLILISNLIS